MGTKHCGQHQVPRLGSRRRADNRRCLWPEDRTGSLKVPPPPAVDSIDSRTGEYRMPNGRRPTQPPLPLLGRLLEADDARPVGVDDLPGRLRRRLGGLANVLAGQNLDGAVVVAGDQDANHTSGDQRWRFRLPSLGRCLRVPDGVRSPTTCANRLERALPILKAPVQKPGLLFCNPQLPLQN